MVKKKQDRLEMEGDSIQHKLNYKIRSNNEKVQIVVSTALILRTLVFWDVTHQVINIFSALKEHSTFIFKG